MSARRATTPGQALRNFLGGLAACEIAVACRTIGLDPAMGIGLHDDVQGRQSLVWDVMEPLRPVLDRLTIEIVTRVATFTNYPPEKCDCVPIGRYSGIGMW
jgi:CRISP-associated protein Cas1